MSTSIFALYQDLVGAEQAVDCLISAGCFSEDISVLIATPVNGAGGTLGLLAGYGRFFMADSTQIVAAGPIWGTLSIMNEVQGTWGLEEILSRLGLIGPTVGLYAADIRNGLVLVSIRCGAFGDMDSITGSLRSSGGESIAPVMEISLRHS